MNSDTKNSTFIEKKRKEKKKKKKRPELQWESAGDSAGAILASDPPSAAHVWRWWFIVGPTPQNHEIKKERMI